MKTISEIVPSAYEIAMGQTLRPQDKEAVIKVCESVLAAYLAQQEPYGYYWNHNGEDGFIRLDEMTGRPPMKEWTPCFLAPPVPAGMMLVLGDELAALKKDSEYLGTSELMRAKLNQAVDAVITHFITMPTDDGVMIGKGEVAHIIKRMLNAVKEM